MSTTPAPTVPAVQILRSDDPEALRLLDAGASLRSESWGARLRVTPAVLASCRAAVDGATGAGWTVRALAATEAEAVVDLDTVSAADYPHTVATAHDVPDAAALAAALGRGGTWAFGALTPGGRLDAVTVLTRLTDRVDTDLTVTRAASRRRGLATAVKAAAVLALAGQGHAWFGTGGAGANAASRRANEALGYEVTERWLHLEVPAG
ncbi:acetyltransferase [Isoptericola sp. NEAU-Y5]|uniref:Acetyltransferase n=1 Tax=Isoptericola luteus TaxID=2879484 RepID=A0ABS7ZFK2_9MICO|nr:acetyltransferase [Isoptericola sp. NEAU-Y5]MCA5892624.1 acetyltransferase [Isoptericola sp. NEAU-Y5]